MNLIFSVLHRCNIRLKKKKETNKYTKLLLARTTKKSNNLKEMSAKRYKSEVFGGNELFDILGFAEMPSGKKKL